MNLKNIYVIFIINLGIFTFVQQSAAAAAPALTEQQKKANLQLILAAKTNNVNLARKALDMGADINIDIQPLHAEAAGQPPIFLALHNKNKDVAKFLLRNGALKSLEQLKLIESYKNRPKQLDIKLAKEVIDELIKEQNTLSLEESEQAKKDISLAADLPIDVANIIAGYAYGLSIPKEDLEKLKQLSQEIIQAIGG